MVRWLPALTLLLLVGCSSARPATAPRPLVNRAVDPVTEPSIVGAVDEAVLQGTSEAEKGAVVGRRVGRVAGFLAAIFGGPEKESLDDTIDRYRRTRDAVTVVGALIGAADGVMDGAERGFELDVQVAELHSIAGVEIFRPAPDLVEARMANVPDARTLAAIAAVFKGREPRAIQVEAAGDVALDVREALIAEGLPHETITARRNDDLSGLLLRITYQQ